LRKQSTKNVKKINEIDLRTFHTTMTDFEILILNTDKDMFISMMCWRQRRRMH